MKKQILLAVDESAVSLMAIDYLASFFANRDEVHFQLVHCVTQTAGALPEPEDDKNSLMPDRPIGKAQQRAQRCLAKAMAKFKHQGIDETRISSTISQSSDIARSLLSLAEKDLVDCVAVARRGVGVLGEMLLGSVSASLFDKSCSIPLWIIDGAIDSTRILVPVDGTVPSMMAVDHLAHIFSDRCDVQFFLFHARGFLSPPPVCRPEDFYDKWGQEWCDKHLSGDGCLFAGPTEILTGAGIAKECITPLPQPTTLEESGAILNSARKNNCGTIVIGRRPENRSKGFFGGISRRTIKQTENMALWVIG